MDTKPLDLGTLSNRSHRRRSEPSSLSQIGKAEINTQCLPGTNEWWTGVAPWLLHCTWLAMMLMISCKDHRIQNHLAEGPLVMTLRCSLDCVNWDEKTCLLWVALFFAWDPEVCEYRIRPEHQHTSFSLLPRVKYSQWLQAPAAWTSLSYKRNPWNGSHNERFSLKLLVSEDGITATDKETKIAAISYEEYVAMNLVINDFTWKCISRHAECFMHYFNTYYNI